MFTIFCSASNSIPFFFGLCITFKELALFPPSHTNFEYLLKCELYLLGKCSPLVPFNGKFGLGNVLQRPIDLYGLFCCLCLHTCVHVAQIKITHNCKMDCLYKAN